MAPADLRLGVEDKLQIGKDGTLAELYSKHQPWPPCIINYSSSNPCRSPILLIRHPVHRLCSPIQPRWSEQWQPHGILCEDKAATVAIGQCNIANSLFEEFSRICSHID